MVGSLLMLKVGMRARLMYSKRRYGLLNEEGELRRMEARMNSRDNDTDGNHE
jgi:hypothetical protein